MKSKIYILLGAWCGLSACQEELGTADDADRCIYLAAKVEGAGLVDSRTPYELTTPTLAKSLSVDVWASTESSKFQHDDNSNGKNGTVAYHTTARFTHGSEQLLDDVIYPKTEGGTVHTVYFVGMHPRGWNTTDGTSATHTFDGKEDVMFAPQVSGAWAENTTNWPVLSFKHLLTWLRLKLVADNETISDAWGKVTGLTIQSKNKVTVDLNQTYEAKKHDVNGACVNFSETANLSFYQTGTDVVFPNLGSDNTYQEGEGYQLQTSPQEVAYVLCAPVNATASAVVDGEDKPTSEYVITIETEKRGTVTASIDLEWKGEDGKGSVTPFSQSTMGYQFTIQLRFKMGDNIAVTAVAEDWQTGGMGTADVNGESDSSNSSGT